MIISFSKPGEKEESRAREPLKSSSVVKPMPRPDALLYARASSCAFMVGVGGRVPKRGSEAGGSGGVTFTTQCPGEALLEKWTDLEGGSRGGWE